MAQTAPTFHTINPLPDGSRLHLRAIRSSDRDMLQAEFDKLSSESVRNRFLSAKRDLTSDELDFLTQVDFTSHVALVAELQTEQGLVPVAVGRFVRDPEMPDHAEFALTVADAWQNRGIGTTRCCTCCATADSPSRRSTKAISIRCHCICRLRNV